MRDPLEITLDPQDHRKLLLRLPTGAHVSILMGERCGEILSTILRAQTSASRPGVNSVGAPIQYVVDAWASGEADFFSTTPVPTKEGSMKVGKETFKTLCFTLPDNRAPAIKRKRLAVRDVTPQANRHDRLRALVERTNAEAQALGAKLFLKPDGTLGARILVETDL